MGARLTKSKKITDLWLNRKIITIVHQILFIQNHMQYNKKLYCNYIILIHMYIKKKLTQLCYLDIGP